MLPLLLTGIGVFATLFAKHTEKDISTALSAGVYFILSATAGPYAAYQPGFVNELKRHWWKFMIIGLFDFYSTYLKTLAFQYTSLSSNQVCPSIHTQVHMYMYTHTYILHTHTRISYTCTHICYVHMCMHTQPHIHSQHLYKYSMLIYIHNYINAESV